MAVIGKFSEAPEINWLDQLPTLDEGEVILFLNIDRQIFTAPKMVLSMAATTMARYGSPFKASDFEAVSRIGVFAVWEAKKKMGYLCDSGFFARYHYGTEEYFVPERAFLKFLEEADTEVRKPPAK